MSIKAYYAGHVLGAAMFEVRVGQQSVVYTVSWHSSFVQVNFASLSFMCIGDVICLVQFWWVKVPDDKIIAKFRPGRLEVESYCSDGVVLYMCTVFHLKACFLNCFCFQGDYNMTPDRHLGWALYSYGSCVCMHISEMDQFCCHVLLLSCSNVCEVSTTLYFARAMIYSDTAIHGLKSSEAFFFLCCCVTCYSLSMLGILAWYSHSSPVLHGSISVVQTCWSQSRPMPQPFETPSGEWQRQAVVLAVLWYGNDLERIWINKSVYCFGFSVIVFFSISEAFCWVFLFEIFVQVSV